MTRSTAVVVVASLLVTIGGPAVLRLVGVIRQRAASTEDTHDAAWDWRLTFDSAVLYALAFSLIFFIQEFFLVVPKALTPGLRPTLFHNNHHWEGDNPLANLLQGAGALAIFATAIVFAFWLKRRPQRTAALRLFVIWMAFHGFFESIPQVVVGAVLPQNDVGMAMEYLHLSPAAKLLAALAALAAIPVVATGLIPPLLALAHHPSDVDSAGKRSRFIGRVATYPALIGIPLIILFRVPGTFDQVVIVPIAVTIVGISWIQAGAWRATSTRSGESGPVQSIRYPLILLILLFLVFQLVLRPGIVFF